MGENSKEATIKKRKNQEILDFILFLKKKLNDEETKNYGLYMKLYKENGKEKMLEALSLTLKRNPQEKFRYFLSLLIKSEKQKELLKDYQKLRKNLAKKFTPQYQRRASERTKLQSQISKTERKIKNKTIKNGL